MNGEDNRAGGFPLSACCYILLQSPPTFVNWLEALVMKVGYH
jgi:hypothetical protein